MILSIDGNNVGKKIEQYIFAGSLFELAQFSKKITDYINTLKDVIESYDGRVYMCGGDNILASVSNDKVQDVIRKIYNIHAPEKVTFSIGLGNTPSLAYLALQKRKSNVLSPLDEIAFCYIDNDQLHFKTLEIERITSIMLNFKDHGFER